MEDAIVGNGEITLVPGAPPILAGRAIGFAELFGQMRESGGKKSVMKIKFFGVKPQTPRVKGTKS